MAKEIGFEFRGRYHIMLSCTNNLKYWGPLFNDNSRIFLHVIINGKLKLL